MDKCEELLPDYYSFVKGVVDSDDLSLNISRETLQNDKKVSQIAKSIESKIHKELINMLNEDRDKYVEFFKEFGTQIKYGIYNNFGMDKDKLEDLLLFYSSKEGKYVTLKEYVDNMIESQDKIYYACGESNDRIDNMPQVEQVKNKKYDILYLTNYVDEFAIKALMKYEDKEFVNVCNSNVDLDSEEEKEEVKRLSFAVLMMQGIATSIDALSVGFTTAGYGLVMAVVCSLIVAVVTFVICETGLCLGKTLGTKLSGKADVLGGVILIGIGIVSWGRGM